MSRFLTQLVIFTMILTAPLSYTGDRCPDFRPDFEVQVRINASEQATAVRSQSIASHPAATALPSPERSVLLPSPVVSLYVSAHLHTLHDRAPPRHS
ncbi:MAG: hypothetical protein WBI04_04165 [Trichlorobacter sp.]|jgi:hypothetical protein